MRSYDGDVLSLNERLLELAGTQKKSSEISINDMPWKHFKEVSDAADVLAKGGDVREAVSLYFHPVKQEWVLAVTVKFSYQSSTTSELPLQWDGQPVIYILMMDVSDLSHPQTTYRLWGDTVRVDYEKNKVSFKNNTSLSRNDLVCLSYYLENMSQSRIAAIMNQSIKTVEKRISTLRNTLLPFDPDCDNLHHLCRKHGLRQMFELKRDWFDKRPVSFQITNMQWQSFPAPKRT